MKRESIILLRIRVQVEVSSYYFRKAKYVISSLGLEGRILDT